MIGSAAGCQWRPHVAQATRAAIVLALLCVLPAAPGQAQDEAAAAPRISLSAAIARALADNPALNAREDALAAARWSHRQARAQLLPALSLESRYTRLDDQTVGRANAFGREITLPPDSIGAPPRTIEIPQTVFRHGYETSLSAQLLLFNPGVWNAAALAGTARDAAQWQYEAQRQETAYQTLRAFIALLKLQSLVAIQEQHLAQASKNRAQAERLEAVGRYAEADVLRWRVEEARQSGILLQQQSARQVAALTVENLIGEPPRGRLVADTLLPAALESEVARFRSWSGNGWEPFMDAPLSSAIAANPQLRISERAQRVAELQHRQSLVAFLPSVVVAGSYGWQNNDTIGLDGERAWSLSAVVSMPLFTSGANHAAHQASRWKLSQADAEAEEARRGLLLAAEAGRTAIRSHAEQLRLAEVNLTSARRNYEIRANNFALGRLSNLEWIDAHLALLEAEQTLASAQYDLVLAIADFHQACGRILRLVVSE